MKNVSIQLPALLTFLIFTSSENLAQQNNLAGSFVIENYEWLVGSWVGDGFGGHSEEIWTAPVDGTMMGMYRHHNDGEIVFYEFLLLDETGLRLKHFNPDITGWEEKDDFMIFEMISYTKDKLEMKGLVFERISDTEMEIRLKMKDNAGEVRTEIFSMKKKSH